MIVFGFPRNTWQSILLREEVQPKKCWLTQEALECRWPLGAPSSDALPYFGLENGAWTQEFLGLGLPDVSVTTCFIELMSQAVLNLCASFKLVPLPGESLFPSSTSPIAHQPSSPMDALLFEVFPSLCQWTDHSFLLVSRELSQSSLGNPTNYLTPSVTPTGPWVPLEQVPWVVHFWFPRACTCSTSIWGERNCLKCRKLYKRKRIHKYYQQ